MIQSNNSQILQAGPLYFTGTQPVHRCLLIAFEMRKIYIYKVFLKLDSYNQIILERQVYYQKMRKLLLLEGYKI